MGWLKKLREHWHAHKYSFLSSLFITLLGLALYLHTYVAEANTPLAQFIDSIEVKTYDTRFRVRGLAEPSPAIAIVAIDQKTLDDLGAWPFSRVHYTRMLDHLVADGARVIGFDITFPKPDDKSGLEIVRRARGEYLARVPAVRQDATYLATLDEMEQQADSDAQFAAALRRAGNVVLAQLFFFNPDEVKHVDPETQQAYEDLLAFGAYPQVRSLSAEDGRPPPSLAETYTGLEGYLPQPNLLEFADAVNYNFGYFDFVPEADSIYRRAPLVIKHKQDYYPSLDVQVLRYYLGVPDQEFGLFYDAAGVEYVQFGVRHVPTDPEGRLLINYQGPAQSYRYISFSDVVAGNFPAGTFTEKMVLVGPTAKGIGDVRPVPLQQAGFPGVEIHANVLDTMLTQRFLHRGLREELVDLLFIMLFGIGMGWFLTRVPPIWSAPLTVTTLAVFLGMTYVSLAQLHLWLNVVLPGSVLVTNFGLVTAFRVLLEEREKRKTRTAFQQYVPPGLIRALMKNPERLKLGGEERELTIMFSDIRGFTTLSERLAPLELTHFLNAYTDEMTDILFRHWGTLDKFEGDAIMAFWGAPFEQDDHMLRACGAALEMGRRVDELRQQWRAQGLPEINIGLGINTGRVVVGNMGSRKRFNYTVLGDPVNLASRLEGVNKEYATRIIVSEFTYAQALDVLGILERRLSREFNLAPWEVTLPNGRGPAERARKVALYVGHTHQLASPEVLLHRYGARDQREVTRAVAQVEQWEARDKKLRSFLELARRSLHPLLFRQLDWIRVKGRAEPVAIYELLGLGGENHRYRELLDRFAHGLQAYRNQHWEEARALFEVILQAHPDDGPSRLFAARCRQFQAQPPEPDWDGVYVMKTK
ncbi:MAG: CHASE2 domain-containing protein [Terriglobia bacterium]